MYCFVDAFYGFHAFLDFVIRAATDRAFRACARARGLMARAAGAACVVRADPTGRDRPRRCGDRIEFEI